MSLQSTLTCGCASCQAARRLADILTRESGRTHDETTDWRAEYDRLLAAVRELTALRAEP